MSDRIKIILTDLPPVRVSPIEWPSVAMAFAHDGKVECQANRTWRVRVRQHADGRAVVYAITTTCWQGESDRYAGELLEPGDDIPAAVHRVCEHAGISAELADACIADLPAVDLD